MQESHRYPPLFKRLAAILYDTLLLMAVSMGYGLLYIGISKLLFQVEADSANGLLFQIGWLATLIGFFCYFWMKGGQTTGMRPWRIKIINHQGHAPSLIQCLLRFLLSPIGWLLFFTYYYDAEKQLLHDKWSQTQLIVLPKAK